MKQHTIVIGGGPAGASTAIYLARFFHSVTLIDAGEAKPGRTSMATHLENFLGNDESTSGSQFLERVGKQLDKFGVKRVADTVTKVSQHNQVFTVTTKNGQALEADYVVVAVGISDNMPEIDGLDPYYDTGIFHCLVCDWYWNKDKKAAVIANNDRGIGTALMMQTLYKPPLLSVVPAKDPHFSTQALERALGLGITVYQSPLAALEGGESNLRALVLQDGTRVEAEVMFTRLSHTRYDQFLDEGGISVDREPERGFIKVNFRTFETSVKNLFAVGPCNEGPDQAIIAGGQGAMAGLEIHSRILDALGI